MRLPSRRSRLARAPGGEDDYATTTRHVRVSLPARQRPAEASGGQHSCALLSLDKEAPCDDAVAEADSGGRYARALHTAPLLTKAASSGLVFGASDACAQGLEARPGGGAAGFDWPRLLTCALLGTLFGPAAHFWYGLMQRSFPRQRARDTLCKTVLGQTIFGPCFTVLFFAATLCEQASGAGGLLQLPRKLRRDFLPPQLAGLGFWSTVDLLSYSCVVPRLGEAWVPLFASVGNFVWTVFLSWVSAHPLPAPG